MEFRLKQMRQRSRQYLGKRMTQQHLAEAVGVTISTVNKIVSGKIANPRFEILESIAEYFSQVMGRHILVRDLMVEVRKVPVPIVPVRL